MVSLWALAPLNVDKIVFPESPLAAVLKLLIVTHNLPQQIEMPSCHGIQISLCFFWGGLKVEIESLILTLRTSLHLMVKEVGIP